MYIGGNNIQQGKTAFSINGTGKTRLQHAKAELLSDITSKNNSKCFKYLV